MPRSISPENQAALEAGRLVARDFVWFVVRDRETGAPVTDGIWSDVGNVTASVINPDTGAENSRNWYGSGTLVSITAVPLVANLAVQSVSIKLSQIDDHVQELVRTYDCEQGRVEIYRGLFDPLTRSMAAPALCRFVGFIDGAQITTPAEGGEGDVTLRCDSHTREFMRSNPDTRSDASQRLRNPTDDFFADVDTAAEWEFFWGSIKGQVPAQPERKKFLGIF